MQKEKTLLNSYKRDWKVLLIGGTSGTGKTTMAKQLGLQLGLPWLQVDDLRLALQYSHVTLPERTEVLYFFLETSIWKMPPERLCKELIRVGELMSPAIEIVVKNHIGTAAPIIIEGDSILPSLFVSSAIRNHAINGDIQAVFLAEPEEERIFANILARGRGTASQNEQEIRIEVRAKWLYGQWLANEALSLHLPVLTSHPWISLVERILTASGSSFPTR